MPKKPKWTGGSKLKAFLCNARAAQSRSKQVDVGFFPESRYPDGEQLPVAQVAAWNEYGNERRPETPFMRSAIADAPRYLAPIAKAGIDPKTMTLDEQTAGQIGDAVKSRIQQNIETAKLIDTHRMQRSVKRKVSDAGSG